MNSEINKKSAQLFKVGGLSQSEVARTIDLDRSTLNRFLRGDADIGASKLAAVLEQFEIDMGKVIDVRIDELLGRTTKTLSLGDALEATISALDPITQKTIMSTILNKLGQATQATLKDETAMIKKTFNEIRTVRRKNG